MLSLGQTGQQVCKSSLPCTPFNPTMKLVSATGCQVGLSPGAPVLLEPLTLEEGDLPAGILITSAFIAQETGQLIMPVMNVGVENVYLEPGMHLASTQSAEVVFSSSETEVMFTDIPDESRSTVFIDYQGDLQSVFLNYNHCYEEGWLNKDVDGLQENECYNEMRCLPTPKN